MVLGIFKDDVSRGGTRDSTRGAGGVLSRFAFKRSGQECRTPAVFTTFRSKNLFILQDSFPI